MTYFHLRITTYYISGILLAFLNGIQCTEVPTLIWKPPDRYLEIFQVSKLIVEEKKYLPIELKRDSTKNVSAEGCVGVNSYLFFLIFQTVNRGRFPVL